MTNPADKPADKPWVLVRKGKPPVRFATQAEAKRFHDQRRFTLGDAGVDATVFGPSREEWRCGRFRHSQWVAVNVPETAA